MTDAAGGPDDAAGGSSFRYSPSEADQPSSTVIRAVSWASGRDPTDLAPLSSLLDVDALDALFSPVTRPDPYRAVDTAARSPLEFSFEYEGYAVAIDGGRVRVVPLDRPG